MGVSSIANANIDTPETHVLDFFYDDEDACALTARINDVRFHIIVHPAKLKSKSNAQDSIFEEYSQRLRALREQHENEDKSASKDKEKPSETGRSGGADSGIDVPCEEEERSPAQDSGVDVKEKTNHTNPDKEEVTDTEDVDREASLQNWILSCMADEVARLAPNRSKHAQCSRLSLHDWYNTPTAFFELTTDSKSSQLTPVDIEETPSLRKRLDDLLPSLPLPKYIRQLPDLPWVDPHDVTVITEATHDPIHSIRPALVRAPLQVSASKDENEADQEFFFKPVDPTQPSLTKREITLLHKIHSLALDKQINVPRLHALVSSPSSSESSNSKKPISTMGLLLTPIPTPLTPLTTYLTPSSLPSSKRQYYADEVERIIKLLHSHDIVFGDAKADNFLVDKHGELWIIDFGGSYTDGWVDPEMAETEEGDWQGVQRVREGLMGDDEEGAERVEEVNGVQLDAKESSDKRRKRNRDQEGIEGEKVDREDTGDTSERSENRKKSRL